MHIEEAIHRRWSASAALSEAVPSGRVFTGQAAAQSVWPYVTVERSGDASSQHTSSKTCIERIPLRMNV